MRIALKFAYDGSNFHGYARQPNLKTVEGDLIDAFIKYGFIEYTKDSMLRSASRTDKLVSAFGNVIAFNTNSSKTDILKHLIDEFEDIVVFGVNFVDDDFYPRYAKYRKYRYYLNISNLDYEKIVSCLSVFTGKHNFSNFARIEPSKDPVREISNIVFSKTGNYILIDFFAQTFLWNQIRRITSALIKVGNEKLEKDDIEAAINNPEKQVDFGVASAEPLILEDIFYDFDFNIYEESLSKLEELKNKVLNKIIF